jgi:PH (Pleckstrin Homology) domain-containing protein
VKTHYTNRHFAQLLMLVAVVFAVVGVGISARNSDAAFVSRWAPAVVILAISAFVYLRLARGGVYADDEGIRIVNPMSTVAIPWAHLVRFTARPSGGFPWMGFAQRVDGTEVQIWGVQARNGNDASKRIVDDVIEQLNERLAQARASSAA